MLPGKTHMQQRGQHVYVQSACLQIFSSPCAAVDKFPTHRAGHLHRESSYLQKQLGLQPGANLHLLQQRLPLILCEVRQGPKDEGHEVGRDRYIVLAC